MKSSQSRIRRQEAREPNAPPLHNSVARDPLHALQAQRARAMRCARNLERQLIELETACLAQVNRARVREFIAAVAIASETVEFAIAELETTAPLLMEPTASTRTKATWERAR